MVNVAGAAASVGSMLGMSGTVGAVLENNRNAGNYGNLYAPNPQGDQSLYGGKLGSMDQQGAGNVGGKNSPPASGRSGLPPGDGTSTSCMTIQESGTYNGDGPPPPEKQFGAPWECTQGCMGDGGDGDDDCGCSGCDSGTSYEM